MSEPKKFRLEQEDDHTIAFNAHGLEVQKLRAENAKLREALENYGSHEWRCLLSQCHAYDSDKGQLFGDKWYKKGDEPSCTCGLDDVLKEPDDE